MRLKSLREPIIAMLALAAGAALADAPAAIKLNDDDLYFQYRPTREFTANGHTVNNQIPKDAVGLCGFSIRGNHNSWSRQKVEWDLNIDEIISGSTRVAGISAGTFDVVGRERKARSPIVALSFSVEHDPEPIPAKIVGSPSFDNAIRAVLDSEQADKLFAAFSERGLISIALKYADSSEELLQIRGGHFGRESGGDKNTFFAKCLRGDTPTPHALRSVN